MAGGDETGYTGITGCSYYSEDIFPQPLKKKKAPTKKGNLPMVFPPELLKGDQDKKTNPLVKYFEQKKWRYTWDFDKKDNIYWYEVLSGDRIIIQIEFEETVEEMIKSIKSFVPDLKDAEDFDKKTPAIIKKHLETMDHRICLYIGNWKG